MDMEKTAQKAALSIALEGLADDVNASQPQVGQKEPLESQENLNLIFQRRKGQTFAECDLHLSAQMWTLYVDTVCREDGSGSEVVVRFALRPADSTAQEGLLSVKLTLAPAKTAAYVRVNEEDDVTIVF